ncbi:MAG: hypothetical protein SGJ09_11420 [Phycisphaerae bacterium]|nr:hypothetical protein [Phycisphaerae bacterium]
MARGPTFHPRASRRLWWGSLLTALLLSLLPTRWLLGWTNEIGGLVRFPLVPFQHVAEGLRTWLRPMPDPRGSMPTEIRALDEQLERARTYYRRLELERDDLQQRIALLERTKPKGVAGEHSRVIYATIVATHAPSGRSVGSLLANVGERQAVVAGMVAAWDGDIVVGRVVDAPGRLSSLIAPVTALSGVEVRLFPVGRELDAALAPGGVLKAMPDGSWTTDLTQSSEVAEGWIARVADERWPLASRMMRIGVVERVNARDDAPLVKRLTIRPLVDPFRVPHVVLVDDALEEGAP